MKGCKDILINGLSPCKTRRSKTCLVLQIQSNYCGTQTIASPKPEEAGELGPAMVDVLISALGQGVDLVFAYLEVSWSSAF